MRELLTSDDVARCLRVSVGHFRQRIAPLPDFPKPVRLPSAKGLGTPRWVPDEVREWVERQR